MLPSTRPEAGGDSKILLIGFQSHSIQELFSFFGGHCLDGCFHILGGVGRWIVFAAFRVSILVILDLGRGVCCSGTWPGASWRSSGLALAFGLRFSGALAIHVPCFLAVEALALALELLPFFF